MRKDLRTIRFLLLLEAAAFAAAASIHFGLLTRGYEHQRAGVAESVIAGMLLAGLALTAIFASRTRRIGLVAQAFALLGTLVGVFTVAIGIGPRTVADVGYHVAMVGILIWGLVVAKRVPTETAPRHA